VEIGRQHLAGQLFMNPFSAMGCNNAIILHFSIIFVSIQFSTTNQ